MLVLGAGLTLGAFTSRFLAENFYHTLAGLNSPPWTALVSLTVALALLASWHFYSAACARQQGKVSLAQTCPEPCLERSRRDSRRPLADDALTYIPLFLLLLYLAQKQVNPLQAKVLLCGSLLLVIAFKVRALLRIGSWKLEVGNWNFGLGIGHWSLVIGSGLFILTFIIYLSTLSPTVGEADSFEFQVVSYTLGVAHPTGYPLYTLLGKLFTLLPIGNVAYRVNLISPLFASLAVVFLYLCLMHLTRHRAASLLAALTFAFSRTFWSQAVIAEVYTLNAFFVALVFYLLLRQINKSTNQQINRLAFVYGLSLTNHLTMILLAPAMAIYALLTKPHFFTSSSRSNFARPGSLRPGSGQAPGPGQQWGFDNPLRAKTFGLWILNFGLLLGLFLLGLSVYLYLPLRWPALHGRPIALGEFVHWVLGSRFRGALRWDAWLKDPQRYLILARLILKQYGWVGLILGLLGLVRLFAPPSSPPTLGGKEGERKVAMLLLVAYLAYFIYGLNYYVPDISAFIIPVHLIFAIWIGAGLHVANQQIGKSANRLPCSSAPLLPCSSAPLLLCSLVALLPLSLLWTNLPQVDMSQHGWGAYHWGQYVLGLDLPAGAAILADSEKIAPLYYLQRVEGMRPDLDIMVMGDEAGYRQQLESRVAQGQPVYLTRYLPGLEGRFHLRSLGPLVEVGTTPLTDARGKMQDAQTLLPCSPAPSLPCSFGRNIRLLGYEADSLTIEPPGHLRLTLFWQAVDRIDTNYHVRLRLVGESGHVWLEEEGRHPVNGYYPTVAWRPGEIIPDFHELAITRALPPGPYKLEVGLFPPFSQDSVWDAQIGRVHILEGEGWQSPEDLTIPYPLRASFAGELILLGYDRPSLGRPDGQAPLTLYWQRLREGKVDYDIALQLLDEDGKVFWQEDAPPLFGEYPTSRWGVGQIVQTSHDLIMPSTVGEVGLRVGLSLPDSGEMLPVRSRWLASLSEWCPLRPIQVQSVPLADGPAINFDNRILLLGYDLDRRQLRPGETLQLSLTWQCLRRMDEDYTVFVHILDEEQRIWGQEDIGPVHGTYPTSQWKEGEIIEDVHSVRLSYEAPPGEYRIEAGLYLLATMARLPVLDEEMRPIDDKIIIEMTNDQ